MKVDATYAITLTHVTPFEPDASLSKALPSSTCEGRDPPTAMDESGP
jgi:hypothetical protein